MLVLRKVQKLFLAAVGIVIADLQLYQSFQHSLGLDGMVGAVVFGIAALLAMPALSLLGYQETDNKSSDAHDAESSSNVKTTQDENSTFDKILKKAKELHAETLKLQPAIQVVDASQGSNNATSLLQLRHSVSYVASIAGLSQNSKSQSSLTSNLSTGVQLRVATEMQNLLKLARFQQANPISDPDAAKQTHEDMEKMMSMVMLLNTGHQHKVDDPEAHLVKELKKLFNVPDNQTADFKKKLKKFNVDTIKEIAHWKGFKPIWEWVKSLFKAVAFTSAVTAPLVATGVMMGGFQKQTTSNLTAQQATTNVTNIPTTLNRSPSCEGSTINPITDRQQFDQKLQNEFQQLAANANQDVNAVTALSPAALQSAYPAITRKMCSMSDDTQPPVTLIPINPQPRIADSQPVEPEPNHPLKPKIPLTSLVPHQPTNKRPNTPSVDRSVSQQPSEGDQTSQRPTNRMPYGSRPLRMTPMQESELGYSIPYTNSDSVNSS